MTGWFSCFHLLERLWLLAKRRAPEWSSVWSDNTENYFLVKWRFLLKKVITMGIKRKWFEDDWRWSLVRNPKFVLSVSWKTLFFWNFFLWIKINIRLKWRFRDDIKLIPIGNIRKANKKINCINTTRVGLWEYFLIEISLSFIIPTRNIFKTFFLLIRVYFEFCVRLVKVVSDFYKKNQPVSFPGSFSVC